MLANLEASMSPIISKEPLSIYSKQFNIFEGSSFIKISFLTKEKQFS
jgi:hypothetical protein